MAYSQQVIDTVSKSPKTLGNQLGRWAVHLDFPVTKIAYASGASRQTIYNWFMGVHTPGPQQATKIKELFAL